MKMFKKNEFRAADGGRSYHIILAGMIRTRPPKNVTRLAMM